MFSGSPAWSIFLPNDDTQTDINQRHTVMLIINTHKNLENYTMKEKSIVKNDVNT